MMTEDPPSPKRIRIDPHDLDDMSRDELINKLRDQEKYVRYLEEKTRSRRFAEEDTESDDKLKQHQREALRRENTLVHRLTTKEQELQDYINQIQEMKQAQTQNTTQLRSMLLDPAVNHVFQRMSKEMDESREKLKQTQNELSAWKFTPDSQTGKRLMAKCRMLLQENEELGKVIASGRTAKLEGEIALQKTLVQEMKSNQTELDEFLGDLEEDVEGMQSMIYVLQQQLKETKEQVVELQNENKELRGTQTSFGTDSETNPFLTSSPNRLNQIKEEKSDRQGNIRLLKTYDDVRETSSDAEMMETDQDPTDTSQSYGSEVNHVQSSSHKPINPTVTKLRQDNTHSYDSTDDLSNEPWSPVQQTTEEPQHLQREATPELDQTIEKDVKTDLLPNGVNWTKTAVKEEVEQI